MSGRNASGPPARPLNWPGRDKPGSRGDGIVSIGQFVPGFGIARSWT